MIVFVIIFALVVLLTLAVNTHGVPKGIKKLFCKHHYVRSPDLGPTYICTKCHKVIDNEDFPKERGETHTGSESKSSEP